jgi:hypothetical protein
MIRAASGHRIGCELWNQPNEIAQNPVFDDSPERWTAQATVAHVAFWSAEPARSLQLSLQCCARPSRIKIGSS